MRRFVRFTPRGRSSRFRSGGRRPVMRNPARQRQLEQANFFIDEGTTVSNSSGDTTQVYTHLASIALSLDATLAGSPEQRMGTVQGSLQRALVIHGIVMDWHITHNGYSVGDVNDGKIWSCFQLATDRLEVSINDAPEPASVGSYNPFQTQFPTAVFTNTTPPLAARQNTLPQRIHYSKTQLHYGNTPEQVDVEGALYVPNGQVLNNRPATFNRRLRIRLGDEQGLFLIWTFRTSASLALPDGAARSFVRWARGCIYYRYEQ